MFIWCVMCNGLLIKERDSTKGAVHQFSCDQIWIWFVSDNCIHFLLYMYVLVISQTLQMCLSEFLLNCLKFKLCKLNL